MFARLFAVFPLVAFVSAAHLGARDTECSNGSQWCCDNAISGPTNFVQGQNGLITAVVDAVLGVQITCSVITVNACNQQTVCCNNVEQNGLVNVACSPTGVVA